MDIYARGIVHGEDVAHQAVPATVRRVATDALPIYSGFSMTILDPTGRSLNERVVTVGQVQGAHRVVAYLEEADLRLLLHEAAYHLSRIIELYVERNQAFGEAHDLATTIRGNTGEPRVYYEVSALLTAARTWFDALLRLLWKHYGTGVRLPRHFTSYIGAPSYHGMLPVTYEQALADHWQSWGRLINDYRNSAVHRAPLNEWGTTCWIEPLEQRWALTVRLPANPTAARADFDFENGPDALDYCHQTLCHLVDLAEETCALPPIRQALDHPPRLK
jgi:hypothetical protein